jgi:TPR repeat protein
MRNLTSTICLAVALLLGSAGVAWSQDFGKGAAAYKSGDYATALREWTPLAKQGSASAQYSLGEMYENGWGVPQNFESAVKWYRLAAEQGHASAQYKLKKIKPRLVSKGIDECLYKEVAKITGPESKKIVEKHCRKKLENKSLDWLLRYAD